MGLKVRTLIPYSLFLSSKMLKHDKVGLVSPTLSAYTFTNTGLIKCRATMVTKGALEEHDVRAASCSSCLSPCIY